MNEALRQTGRTTRLVEKAVQQAECGFAVYVVTHQNEMRRLQDLVEALWASQPRRFQHHGIKVESPFSIGIDSWNWERMQPRGCPHPNCVFLVDHYLVEQRITLLQDQIKELAQQVAKLYPLTT